MTATLASLKLWNSLRIGALQYGRVLFLKAGEYVTHAHYRIWEQESCKKTSSAEMTIRIQKGWVLDKINGKRRFLYTVSVYRRSIMNSEVIKVHIG